LLSDAEAVNCCLAPGAIDTLLGLMVMALMTGVALALMVITAGS
jgi:hypothetical protein